MTKELFTRQELIKMLDDWGIEYEIDSPTPGIGLPDGTIIPWDEVMLPSDYFKAIDERTIELPEGLRLEEEMIRKAYEEEKNELH